MLQFTLTQLLMGTALVAILLGFTQTEGCGERYTRTECVSFSGDGSRLAVSKLNARDARIPLKRYKADVARTLSLLNSSDGTTERRIHQDFLAGNQGTAFHLWEPGRKSALLNPLNDRLLAIEFGGGALFQYTVDAQAKPIVISPSHPALNIALSRSGRYVAVSGDYAVSVWDLSTDTSVMEGPADGAAFLQASHMSFSADETRLVTTNGEKVRVWDIATGKVTPTRLQGVERVIQAVSFVPDDTVIVCSYHWVRRYDLSGKFHSTLVDSKTERYHDCSVSPDGQLAAVIDGDDIVVHDLTTGRSRQAGTGRRPSSLAFSPDSKSLAVATWDGVVSLIDVTSGKVRWSVSPPGRNRWPWTILVPFLAIWGFTARRIWKKRNSVG